MVSISPPFARVLGRDYARELLEEELSLLTGAVLCSRPHLIRLDGNYRRQARVSQLSAAERHWRLWWNICRELCRRAREG